MENRKLSIYFLQLISITSVFNRYALGACPQVLNEEEGFTFTIDYLCYRYIEKPEDQITFSTAKDDCIRRGGQLVTIKNNETQTALAANLQNVSESHTVLLGLQRTGDTWQWITGETVTYTNWETETTCTECNCAKLKMRSRGKWEKFNCQTVDWYTVYICESDLSSSVQGLYQGRTLTYLCSAVFSVLLVSVFH